MTTRLAEQLSELPLLDQHCHPVSAGPVDDATFEMWCTEAQTPPPPGTSYLDSQLGHAVRRWCAPALGLPTHSSIVDYLAARADLDPAEVNERLLRAANLRGLLVDTGLSAAGLLTPAGLAEAADTPSGEILRLETLAERVADATTAAWFADAFTTALSDAVTGKPLTSLATGLAGGMSADATVGVVAVKSVAAYRHGLDLAGLRPTRAEVVAAAGTWLRQRDRLEERADLTDPVLLRFLLWSAVDAGRPLQLHTGFGAATRPLPANDPGLLQPFCEATVASGTPLVLLHCYPYHRQAGWLAQAYPHVYLDVGATIGYVGARSTAVLGEFLELAPFNKLLYSSDGYRLAELIQVGAAQFRHALTQVLSGFADDGAMTEDDCYRIGVALAGGNASRVYGLD